jgi:hypothetical protein
MMSHGEQASASGQPTVTLTADVAPFESGMARAIAAMNRWSDNVEKQMAAAAAAAKKRSDEMTERLSLKKIGEMAIGHLTAQLASASQQVAKELADIASGSLLFQQRLERSKIAASDMADKLAIAAQRQRELLEAAMMMPDQRGPLLEDAWAKAKAQLDEATKQSEAERKAFEKLQTSNQIFNESRLGGGVGDFARNPDEAVLFVNGKLEQEMKKTQQRMEQLEGQRKVALAAFNDLDEKKLRAADRNFDPAARAASNAMTLSLEKQAAALSRSSTELADWEARMKLANGEWSSTQAYRVADAAAKLAVALDKQTVEDYEKAQKRLADTYGQTADQIELYDMRLKGLNETQLKRIELAQQERNATILAKTVPTALLQIFSGVGSTATPIENKFPSAMSGGSREAANAIIAARQSTNVVNMNNPQEKANKLLGEVVKGLTELNRTLGKAESGIGRISNAVEEVDLEAWQ